MWILYTVFGVGFFSMLFIWAVRTRQFTDQERARYLPLEGLEEGNHKPLASEPPEKTQGTPEGLETRDASQ